MFRKISKFFFEKGFTRILNHMDHGRLPKLTTKVLEAGIKPDQLDKTLRNTIWYKNWSISMQNGASEALANVVKDNKRALARIRRNQSKNADLALHPYVSSQPWSCRVFDFRLSKGLAPI